MTRDASVAAAGRQNIGLWPKPRAKLKTASEKSLAPRDTEREFLESKALYRRNKTLWSSPSAKQHRNPRSRLSHVYQDWSTQNDSNASKEIRKAHPVIR